MNVQENVQTKDLTIQGFTFQFPVVVTADNFQETISDVCPPEVAAGMLQQTLAENCRNNFAPKVTAAIKAAAEENDISFKKLTDLSDEDSQTLNDAVDTEALADAFADYINTYVPGVRRAAAGVSLSPVEREATKIALEMVRDHLEQKMGVGRTARAETYKVWNAKIEEEMGKTGAEYIAELAANLIEANASITETAKANIEARQNLSSSIDMSFGE